jgi:hypothetical protein
MRDAARSARRAGLGVGVAPPVLLHVLGDVQEVREVAERAHHVQRLVDRQRVELRLELGLARFAAPEAHRALAHRFDPVARFFADVRADHLAEEPPEQAPVLAQRELLVHRADYKPPRVASAHGSRRVRPRPAEGRAASAHRRQPRAGNAFFSAGRHQAALRHASVEELRKAYEFDNCSPSSTSTTRVRRCCARPKTSTHSPRLT